MVNRHETPIGLQFKKKCNNKKIFNYSNTHFLFYGFCVSEMKFVVETHQIEISQANAVLMILKMIKTVFINNYIENKRTTELWRWRCKRDIEMVNNDDCIHFHRSQLNKCSE